MISYVMENWPSILAAFLGIVFAAEKIADLTPNQTDNKIVAFIRKACRTLALKFPDIDSFKVKDKDKTE